MKKFPNRFAPMNDRLKPGDTWRDTSKPQSANARGYGHKWRIARLDYLQRNPLCVRCKTLGVITAATIVDHIRPHNGDMRLFWDRGNWQALCTSCHSKHKQREEWQQRFGR